MEGGGREGGEGREIIASVQLALSDATTHTVFPNAHTQNCTQNGLHMHSSIPTALEQQHCSGNSPVDNRATQLARLHERGRKQRVWRPGNDD